MLNGKESLSVDGSLHFEVRLSLLALYQSSAAAERHFQFHPNVEGL